LVWVPAVYTSQAFYLTTNGPDWTALQAFAIFVAGLVCVGINYDSDRQRYVFRQTNGNCVIWGRQPRKIVAKYKTTTTSANGTQRVEEKQSLLLLDGWWTISRHFHYVPEILASFFWSLPAGWPTQGVVAALLGPYFYVLYLTILLTDRAFRDDDRCRSKYGKYWDQYCDEVPYKIVPRVI
jgi:7-dehydrocholesterol reductase